MRKVEVILKNGKVISVLPKEVPVLKEAGLLKEEKFTGETKEVTGKVKSSSITTRNVKGKSPKKI